MNKKALFVSIFAITLMLGAGCTAPDYTQEANEKHPPKEEVTKNDQELNTLGTNEALKNQNEENKIMITKAEPGKTQLDVEFEIKDEELKKDADAFILLLTRDEEPTYPTKGYWYELGTAHMSKLWTELPSGERYFRVCVLKKDECVEYSEVVKVEILE